MSGDSAAMQAYHAWMHTMFEKAQAYPEMFEAFNAGAEWQRERDACVADGWDVPCEPRTEAESVANNIAQRIRAGGRE